MNKVISIDNLEKLKFEKPEDKLIVVGGCFDILHTGHIEFLKNAKALGGKLAVMLESDLRVKKLKGVNRPFNNQKERAKVLINLPYVDYVIILPDIKNDKDYEILVKKLEPDIIAVTRGTAVYDWEKSYMSARGGIITVIDRLPDFSTTKIADSIKL